MEINAKREEGRGKRIEGREKREEGRGGKRDLQAYLRGLCSF
jgi:hypothetical protein